MTDTVQTSRRSALLNRPILPIFLIAFSVSFAAIFFFLNRGSALSKWASTLRSPKARRFIFVDAGGNTGQTVEYFFKKHNDVFSAPPDVVVNPNPFDYEVYVWEPDPTFKHHYEVLAKNYSFTLIAAAAGDHNFTTDFSSMGQGGSIHADASAHPRSKVFSVPVIDFSEWLRNTVSENDYVLCKIDIEGSEYGVLRKMMADGTICLCDRMSVEFHAWIGTAANRHRIHFNYPADLKDRIDEEDDLKTKEKQECVIPHLNKQMPYFYCYIPRVLQWVRESCKNAHPLEKWF